MSHTIADRKCIDLVNRVLAPKVRTYIKVQSRIAGAQRLAWNEARLYAIAKSEAMIKIANQAAMARTGKESAYRIDDEDIKFACDQLDIRTRPSLRGGMSTKRHRESEEEATLAAAAAAADDAEEEDAGVKKPKKKKAKTQAA